jgi:hypothetical protein
MLPAVAEPKIGLTRTAAQPTREHTMYLHPTMLSALATERQRELVADAERFHVLSAARRARRVTNRARRATATEVTTGGRTADTLGGCGPSVVPVR